MTTDTTEKGLEALIVAGMTGLPVSSPAAGGFAEHPDPFVGLDQRLLGKASDYDRGWTVDLAQLTAFIAATQPTLVEAFDLRPDGPTHQKFLARLQGEIAKRGVIDVLRKGIKHGPHEVSLFYGTPSPGNLKAAERFAQNRFFPDNRANLIHLASAFRLLRRRAFDGFPWSDRSLTATSAA